MVNAVRLAEAVHGGRVQHTIVYARDSTAAERFLTDDWACRRRRYQPKADPSCSLCVLSFMTRGGPFSLLIDSIRI
jgi:hypothetical protein